MRKKNISLIFFVMLLFFSLSIGRVASVANATLATVSIEPASFTVEEIGDPYTINVTITGVTDLYGWELWLYYPTGILDPYPLMNECATEGPFLKEYAQANGGTTYWVFDNETSTDSYNATHGLIHVGCTILPPPFTGADGAGVLAMFNFTGTAPGGPYAVALEDTEFVDSSAGYIPVTVLSGEVTVIPEFPPSLITPLFMIATLVAIVLGKKAWLGKRRSPFVAK